MTWLALIYRFRWFIITGIFILIIAGLSTSIHFKNRKIDSQLEEIGKIKTELNLSYSKIKEVNSKFDSCQRLLNQMDNLESEKRIIEAITEKIKAEQIGSTWSPELDRCVREREEYRIIIQQLKENNKCPENNEDVIEEIWNEAENSFKEIIRRNQ